MIKKCLRCKRESLIYGKGLCQSCWEFYHIRKSNSRYKKKLENSRKWRKEKGKNYQNEYYHKNIEKLRKVQNERKRNKWIFDLLNKETKGLNMKVKNAKNQLIFSYNDVAKILEESKNETRT